VYKVRHLLEKGRQANICSTAPWNTFLDIEDLRIRFHLCSLKVAATPYIGRTVTRRCLTVLIVFEVSGYVDSLRMSVVQSKKSFIRPCPSYRKRAFASSMRYVDLSNLLLGLGRKPKSLPHTICQPLDLLRAIFKFSKASRSF
jgi:hypothetical protein